MATLGEKLSKFKAIIKVEAGNVDPAYTDLSSDDVKYQIQLTNDASASEVFGMDFLMFAEGGFFQEGYGLKKAAGIFNYAQAITHRLMTTRGTMPGNDFFGVPWGNYVGVVYKNKNVITESLRQDLIDEVLKDSRTQSVEYVDIEFLDKNALTVDIGLIPIYTNFTDIVNITLSTAGE